MSATAASVGVTVISFTRRFEERGIAARRPAALIVSSGIPRSRYHASRSQIGSGSVARMRASRSAVIRLGGRSVSGYMRSGPGRMRSKPFVPSRSACRVSDGMPMVASFARMTISRAPESASCGLAPDEDDRVLGRRASRFPDGLPLGGGEGLAGAVGVDDVGERRETGDDAHAVGDLAGEVRVGLGLPAQESRKPRRTTHRDHACPAAMASRIGW